MPYVTELVADSEADLKEIDTTLLAAGSTCFIIENSNVYMLNSKKEWKSI